MTDLNPPGAQPFQRIDPPYFWPALGDYVIGDRHLPDGTRQHVIAGHAEPGLVVANAHVLGLDDLPALKIDFPAAPAS